LDLDTALNFACFVLTNPGGLWVELPIEQKQQWQAVLFPDGLTYLDGSFGTAKTNIAFSYLRAFSGEKEKMVTPTGFEPVSQP
jgi:hypothetical protein